jgi:hypothetical protein
MIDTTLFRQRNLNIYGFSRPSKGPNASGYVHPEFERNKSSDQLGRITRDLGKTASTPR